MGLLAWLIFNIALVNRGWFTAGELSTEEEIASALEKGALILFRNWDKKRHSISRVLSWMIIYL